MRKPDPVQQLKALEQGRLAQEQAMIKANPWGIPPELLLALNAQAKRRRDKK